MLRNPQLISDLHSAVGASLWQCQALENILIHCVLIGAKLHRNEKLDVVEEMFNKYGELTLGQLVIQVQNLVDVPAQVKQKLELFKKERNWLAHKSWLDTVPYANSTPPTELLDYLDRINRIHDDALGLSRLFSEILEQRVRKAGVSKEYLDRKTQELYSRWLAG
jgi:hypothetical protein